MIFEHFVHYSYEQEMEYNLELEQKSNQEMKHWEHLKYGKFQTESS